MSEYDVALDCQMDWVSFWTSPPGENLFRAIAEGISEQRLEKGERYADLVARHEYSELALNIMPLLNAECYYWSREMLNLVTFAAKSLPDSWSLMRQHIPSVSGFFYLAKAVEGIKVAFAWNVLSVDPEDMAAEKIEKAMVIHLPRSDGSIPDFNALSFTTFIRHPDPHFPKPLPTRTFLYVGESLQDWKVSIVRHAGEINADAKEWEPFYDDLRLFGTMLSFIQQRIMVSTRLTVSRATRKRAMRAYRLSEPDVNVVKLRAVVARKHEGEGEPVEWQCRWIVRGHWRDQWYPSMKKNQPIFISPYIKGPEDKPLRDPKRLFAVVR